MIENVRLVGLCGLSNLMDSTIFLGGLNVFLECAGLTFMICISLLHLHVNNKDSISFRISNVLSQLFAERHIEHSQAGVFLPIRCIEKMGVMLKLFLALNRDLAENFIIWDKCTRWRGFKNVN